jgi:Outer membrane lipoprotein carrier protein LolA-like
MIRRAFGIMLLTLLGVAARAAADDLDELMRLLGARQHGQVDFVEQHFLALLRRPVESWGELFYDAPDRLEKRTLEPRPESLVLAGDVLTVTRGRHRHVLDIKAYPQVLPFVESIRATLAGDRAALERLFRVEYTGNLGRWTLILVPRENAVAKTVLQVRIDGSRDMLRTVEIREVDGDRSLMTLRDHPAP